MARNIRRGGILAVPVALAALAYAYANVKSAHAEQVASNAAPAATTAAAPAVYAPMVTPADHKHRLMQYGTACHNDKLHTAGMSVVPLDPQNLQHDDATW